MNFICDFSCNGDGYIKIYANGGAVTVELDSETLSVVSTKPGGKLVWKDKIYILEPDKKLTLQA